MHEYYRKNEKKLRKAMDGYLRPIAEEIGKETGDSYEVVFEKAWNIYRNEMMENFPYIGGDKASGTKNLTGAFCFVALGVTLTEDYGMALDRWGYLTTAAYEKFFEKFPSFLKKLVPKLLSHPGFVKKMLRKKDRKNEENSRENPGSFVTETQEGTEEFPIIYNMTLCPLADFSKKMGYEKFMPYICNLDYVMFSSLGIPFRRTKTYASGDGLCNFSFAPGQPIVPAWPCHSADPEDPLK